MRCTALAALSFSLFTLLASGRSTSCLTKASAQTIADGFAGLITNYTQTAADALLAPDFTDQSDSVITLIDSGGTTPFALGSLTFASRAAFEAGQSGQPPIPFKILNTWHNCHTVIIRWLSAQQPQEVQGFTALSVVKAPAPRLWQVKTARAEFNSGAWLANLGRPECAGGKVRRFEA